MKEFLKVAVLMALFFAALIAVLTWARNSNRQPSVILTSTECEPPCWYGIRPGESNSSQAYQTLLQLKTVNGDTIREHMTQLGRLLYIDWYFQRPAEDGAGYLYFDNDRVVALRILTVNSLKLEELFEKLGPPETYWAKVGYGENREYLDVHLLYPKKGYLAETIIDIAHDANQVEIHATTPVFAVTYFSPGQLDQIPGMGILLSEQIDALQSWPGYGAISVVR